MPGNKTQGFLCTWKIEKFNSIPNEKELVSPSFQVKKFCHSEWNLVLNPKKLAKSSELGIKYFVSCYLELSASSDIVKEIPVSYRFHLLCPNGDVFKTSELFTEKFLMFKYPPSYYELITVDALKQEMSNWPEDTFTLICKMESVLDYDSLSPTTSKAVVTGCKLETNVCEYDSSFMWSIKESKRFKKYPLTIKEIKLGDITVKMIQKHICGVRKFYLFSDVNDKKHHTLFWCVYLMREKQIEKSIALNFHHNFSDQKNVYYTGAEVDINNLQNEIEVKFDISYLAHSLVNYCYTDEKYDIETQSISLELFKSGRTSEEESVYCLQQNFSKLLVDKEFTDVEFRVDDEMMTGHKNILACRSPVFAAMFDLKMTENNTGIVDIVDVEAKTFSSFLEYIYTGSVKKMDEELALNLLVVADKYDVPSLAKKCSLFLMSVLSNSNLCKVLLIADMVKQKELKSFVVKFILRNSTNILSSPEWLQLVVKNNTLATELLLLISKKFDEESKISEVCSGETSWDCSSCLSENDGDKDKCASCSAVQIDKINKNNIDLSLKKTLWVCSSCPALNVGDETKCTICDGVRENKSMPGSASTAKPSITTFENNLSSTPAVPFQFGNQPTIATSTLTIGFGGAVSNAFAFGSKPETVNSLQPTASSTQMPVPAFGCAPTQPMFGNSTTPAFGKQAPGSFNFGLPTSSNSTPAFQFGVEKTQATPQSGFSFGTPSQDTMNQNFQPQFNISTTPSFNFGAASSTGPFQFAASSDSSQATSAGPRKIRKAFRQMN